MAAALDRFCGSAFWNASFLDRPDPDLPVCVERTVLVWVPLGFLWFCAPWQLTTLFQKNLPKAPMSKLYVCKQISACLLILTAVSELAFSFGEDHSSADEKKNPAVLFVNPSLFAVSWLLVMLLHEAVRRREKAVDSGSLFIFWLLLVICEIFPFQTLLREALKEGEIVDRPHFYLFYIAFGLKLAALILSAIADVPPDLQEITKKSPEVGAPFLSRITFNWFNRMIFTGYKRPLVQEDMWELNEKDSTSYISQHFENIMRQELRKARSRLQKKLSKKRKSNLEPEQSGLARGVSRDVLVMVERSEGTEKKKKKKEEEEDGESDYPHSWLVLSIVKTFKWVLIESAFFKLLQDLLSFVSPQLLKLLIGFTQDKSIYTWRGYLYASLLLIVAIVQSVFLQQFTQRCFKLGMRVRAAITAAVYKKALTLSNDARKESTIGQMVTLMSADAQRFNEVTNFIHLLWSCPVQIVLSVGFLWIELGPSVLAGLLVMVLMVPINGLLAVKSRSYQAKSMMFKDKRMKMLNEILSGIKILKLYAWEPSFEAQVQGFREQELKVMKKSAYLSSIATFIFFCAPAFVSLATFAVFVSVSPHNILDAEKAFTSISLFNILRTPLGMLPMLISAMVQMTVSKRRLEKFLSRDDLDTDAVHHDNSPGAAVSVTDGTFAWDRAGQPVLKNVSLHINPGRLVAVVGAVGSGKSSLISALLGEMHNLSGSINIKGSVAYVPQQAWVQNATLKDNILFGSDLDEQRFQRVLEACALEQDLELLPAGVQTEIGEKGINLSGGQKQRVSLARAAYSSADVYLLDDPLSAVDAHVGKHLFERVIGPRGLLKDKTRILVTHGINFLPYVDEVVVLVDGVVSEVASYSSLRSSKGAFSEFLATYAKEEIGEAQKESASGGQQDSVGLSGQDHQDGNTPEEAFSVSLKKGSQSHCNHSNRDTQKNKENISPRARRDARTEGGQRLIEMETVQTGRVKLSVYLQYLTSMGWSYGTTFVVVYFVQSVAFIGQNLWLSDWTNDAVRYPNGSTYPAHIRDVRVGAYGGLGMAQGFLVFVGTLILADGAIHASRTLHTGLLSSILRAPMLFFDTTPSGRVVNRFAKDMFTVDELIPIALRTVILKMLELLATLVLICLAVPLFTAVVIPLIIVYHFVERFYLTTSRQLRRLDSVSRSPIYSHFGETVSGLSVIRAFGHQEHFLKQNKVTIDNNLKCICQLIVSNRWMAIRLELLGNLVVFFSALFAVISRDSLDSGLVGLSISYALNVTLTLNALVRMTSQLETHVVSVERVKEYVEIPSEASWTTEKRLADDWPGEGKIRFEDYKVRYRPQLELVLHGINCDIESCEKIGIVGRTGAGKSSLTNCLFRIMEAADGRILIDGVDIARLGLHDLRSRLTIIPQDPVLFSGTLRMNLDPFEKFSDEEIWTVLQLAHLKEYVGSLAAGLQHEVAEGGENLSVGQRQLLCLARALLRKSKILILDEATAAVDLETDDLIQTTIRREFSHCTVLTIAHRINTILDSSRVMVLDAGRIVEFGSPGALLQKQGHFFALAKDAGICRAEMTAL
ncbi:ATP-binding cassette sub-family C member 2-like [Salminus brasiliensis]|uniref:ATP-binding cassette sub-family C member 2-like n=1 Tax=Salminus brasiliensis TaxID=930266 RepID=UPI003B82EE5E